MFLMGKREVFSFVMIVIVVLGGSYLLSITGLSGRAVSGPPGNAGGVHTIGPSAEEQSCMMKCMGCSSLGENCTGNQDQCTKQCNLRQPESGEGTACMEECVARGCDKYDFACQGKNQVSCEKECNMIKEPEAKSEEEQCIRDCVNKESPGTICRASQEGEAGNELCQRCAKECEHLYEGPCIGEEEIRAKQKACETCEHCYGETVMGDSGEGCDCIVDVKCGDASSEFGDEPGTGPGIAKGVSSVIESIGNFFKGIFGGGETESLDQE